MFLLEAAYFEPTSFGWTNILFIVFAHKYYLLVFTNTRKYKGTDKTTLKNVCSTYNHIPMAYASIMSRSLVKRCWCKWESDVLNRVSVRARPDKYRN